MRKSNCLLFTAFTFISLTSYSQEDFDTKNTLENLQIVAGTWTVQVEARLSANGPWESSLGTSVIARTVGLTVFEENFTGTREGRPFVTKTLLALNNLSKKFQRIFVDSEHGTLVDFEGVHEKNEFLFDKNWAYPNNTTVRLRVVYKIISPNEFSIESMRMPQDSKAWDVTGRLRYVRAK